MTWQELIVAAIVALAVVSLYRHLRGMLSVPKTGGGASCHSCDDECDAEVAGDSSSTTPHTH